MLNIIWFIVQAIFVVVIINKINKRIITTQQAAKIGLYLLGMTMLISAIRLDFIAWIIAQYAFILFAIATIFQIYEFIKDR